ncbi:MAG: tRNA uridine-5-carboxymethylaminomethyl(34) synthesis GTPase MnmE [Bacteroidota bacterium]|jgi:tRNA modification GTPase
MRLDLSDTIVALATPPGRGAIGVIRLSGPGAFEIADQVFSGKKLSVQPTHTAHFGRLRTREGKELDEVLATIFHGSKSYTGQPTIEFSCHGSPFILQKAIELCLSEGARLAEPGEFTMRAFLNGKLDLSQAEAVADLIASESEAAHAVALNQLRGGFRKEIEVLRDELIHFASLVELELDFSEEDVEFADRAQLKELVMRIRRYLNGLISSFSLGNAIKTGVTTVIAGRPNAGKSTLLNALLNEARAIVSDIPGTTRDTIEEVLNINGIQFRLVDTAGIREAQDQIEAIGVQRTLDKVKEAAVLLYVWDVAGGMTLGEVFADLQNLRGDSMKLLVVCNKMDRNPHFRTDWLVDPGQTDIHPYLLGDPPADLSAHAGTLETEQLVPVSAKNEQNIALLKEKLFELAAGGILNLESTVVSNARHFDALQRADQALQDVLHGLDTGITGDFIAQDIRRSLAYLGEITGEIGVDDLLANIFGKFCIGK